MKEILRNGPINGDFQAPAMFSIYKEGIFSEQGMLGVQKKSQASLMMLAQTGNDGVDLVEEENLAEVKGGSLYSDTTLNDKGISWMDMNHSVVIVGWGSDKQSGTKFWIVRNSYGQQWGMNGDFLVKKGGNDFGMEVEQIAFEPELCGEDSTDVCITV